MSSQLLPIASIDLPDRAWPRHTLNDDRVQEFSRRYLDDGPFALDPVLVTPLPAGRFLLVNGRHRVAARRLISAADVAAEVTETGGQDPVSFAYAYALADSARSALPLTRAEKHAAVLRLLTEQPGSTDVAIAGLVGVSSKTVQRARKWLAEHPDGEGEQSEDRPEPSWQPPSAHQVADALVRQLSRLWDSRPLGMALGVRDSGKLGDYLGDAFVERVGPDEALVWTERLKTWAIRAHAVAEAAAREQAS